MSITPTQETIQKFEKVVEIEKSVQHLNDLLSDGKAARNKLSERNKMIIQLLNGLDVSNENTKLQFTLKAIASALAEEEKSAELMRLREKEILKASMKEFMTSWKHLRMDLDIYTADARMPRRRNSLNQNHQIALGPGIREKISKNLSDFEHIAQEYAHIQLLYHAQCLQAWSKKWSELRANAATFDKEEDPTSAVSGTSTSARSPTFQQIVAATLANNKNNNNKDANAAASPMAASTSGIPSPTAAISPVITPPSATSGIKVKQAAAVALEGARAGTKNDAEEEDSGSEFDETSDESEEEEEEEEDNNKNHGGRQGGPARSLSTSAATGGALVGMSPRKSSLKKVSSADDAAKATAVVSAFKKGVRISSEQR